MDAIGILLQDKTHASAQKLLALHHANADFLPRVVAEFRMLKGLGRKGGINSIMHFLRWDQDWRGIDEFEINQNLAPLVIRVCVLLWPDINGMAKLNKCSADKILGTFPANVTMTLPAVPVLERPGSFHEPIAEAEARRIVAPLHDLVAQSPNPNDPLLLDWLNHVDEQPEVYVFTERKLLRREPTDFSVDSLLEYTRWSIRRAAESHKRFTLRNNFAAFYCRALIMLNQQFNGLCRFKEDSHGEKRPGRANRLLGTHLASETIDGEPFPRLLWAKASQ